MYGNERLPGVSVSETYRYKGSIWQGSPASTWFKAVRVNGTDGASLAQGTVMKELTDGTYARIEASDIVSAIGDLPGARLTIVADSTGKTGTSATTGEGEDAVTESDPSTVVVGVHGQVDKARVLVGDKVFTELTEAQQRGLNLQLEAWGFMLVNVMQG